MHLPFAGKQLQRSYSSLMGNRLQIYKNTEISNFKGKRKIEISVVFKGYR
jgi:hypothetical protein